MTDTTDTTNTADVGLEADDIWGDVDFGIDFDSMSTDEIRQRRVMIENEIKIFKVRQDQVPFGEGPWNPADGTLEEWEPFGAYGDRPPRTRPEPGRLGLVRGGLRPKCSTIDSITPPNCSRLGVTVNPNGGRRQSRRAPEGA